MRVTIALLLAFIVIATAPRTADAVACNSCFCVESQPSQRCVHGSCYTYRGTPYCRCDLGYRGNRCHLPIQGSPDFADPCTPNPCLNFGYCQDYLGTAICTCLTGFTGPFCESTTTASPCDDAVCKISETCAALQLGYICL